MKFDSNYSRVHSKRNKITIYALKFCILCVLIKPAIADDSEIDKSVNTRPGLSHQRKDINESEGIIRDIISKQPFVNVQEETVWDFAENNQQEDEPLDDQLDMNWLTGFVAFISMIIEAALWLAPLLAVFYLYRYREYWLRLIKGEPLRTEEILLPETLFGLDVKRDSLPDDIESAARQFWKNNQPREAVSLLYRGAIVVLFERYRFELPSGATEQDCIRYIENQHKADNKNNDNAELRIERFKEITSTWIAVAYAHRLPDDEIFYEICEQWNKIFFVNDDISNKVKS